MEKGNLVDVVVVYEQQEHYLQAAVEPNAGINIELLQCQILSLVGLLPDEQILVTSRGEIIVSPSPGASMALSTLPVTTTGQRERVFVVNAAAAKDAGQEVPCDWREICTRCTFGDLSVVQPAFRPVHDSDTDALICGACATTCSTDATMMSPLEWRSSKKLAARFISELLVIAGDVDVPIPPGFTKIPGDLNYSASGDFVHLFVKRGGTRVLTQVTVRQHPWGEQKLTNSASSSTVHLKVDCNSGSGSDIAVFLSYDSISTSQHESMYANAITDLKLIVGDAAIPQRYVKIPVNLNEGSPGSEAIYLSYKLAPLGGFVCANSHGAFGECLFQSRHSTQASLQTVVPAGGSPQRDAVLSSLDNARQRADSTYLENHYRQYEPGMRSRLQGGIDRVKTYENSLVQAEALKRIPVEKLHERARANPTPLPSYQDELVMQLTHWFKREFFTWMNQPRCSVCSFEKTQLVRTDPPSTPEEVAGQAGRVEVYQCSQCRGFTRFPRYNDPVKLLDTRTGRCGEWANCFTLCCRAMGFEARYVLDVTDHVWTEVYSEHHKRWLHCDSCEDQLDRPLTYEVGWGKQLSYIFSFSHEEVVDTARRYTQNWDDMKLRRSEVSEVWLASTIQQMNHSLRQSLAHDRIRVLDERATQEQSELSKVRKATAEEVQGRVSGSNEWKSQRNEDGKGSEDGLLSNVQELQHLHSSGETLSATELLQKLAKAMLLGCDRGSKCTNPRCLPARLLAAPDLSPTDRTAQALQEVAAIQAKNFSSHGLTSLLCSPAGGVEDFILSHAVSVYLPLQDSVTNGASASVVDVSGNNHHGQSTGPLRKPFRIPTADGSLNVAFGMQVLPGRKLVVPVPSMKSFAVSWLVRFDSSSFETSSDEAAMSVHFGDERDAVSVFVRGGELNAKLSVGIRCINGEVVTSPPLVQPGTYYHFFIDADLTVGSIVTFVNGNEAVRVQPRLERQLKLSGNTSSIIVRSPAVTNKNAESPSTVPVICHFAVLPKIGGGDANVFMEGMKRLVCWPPLKAYDASGLRTDKTCTQLEAIVQTGYRVGRVRMWGGEFFDGIQLVYEKACADGTIVTVEGQLVGNRAAHDAVNSPTVEFFMFPNEYLVGLSGRKGAWTDCVRLETSFGRSVTCGGSGGGEFGVDLSGSTDEKMQIRAIQFDVGDHLVDAVAFVADAPATKEDESMCELRQILHAVDVAKQKVAISAATRYLNNIVSSPDDAKFQKIRASNKFFSTSVGELPDEKPATFMKWCGFSDCVEGGENFYVFQPAVTAVPKSVQASIRLHYLREYSSEI